MSSRRQSALFIERVFCSSQNLKIQLVYLARFPGPISFPECQDYRQATTDQHFCGCQVSRLQSSWPLLLSVLVFVLISMSQLLHLCPFLLFFGALFCVLPEASSSANTASKPHKLHVTYDGPPSSPLFKHTVQTLMIPNPLPWMLTLFSWLLWIQFCFFHFTSRLLLDDSLLFHHFRSEAWRGMRVGLCSDPPKQIKFLF